MHHHLLRKISQRYVEDYYQQHGVLPCGTHTVRYSCGTTLDCDIYCAGMAGYRDKPEEITYPEKAGCPTGLYQA